MALAGTQDGNRQPAGIRAKTVLSALSANNEQDFLT